MIRVFFFFFLLLLLLLLFIIKYLPGRVEQSVAHLTRGAKGLGFDTRSGHILPFLLPLIQKGQLSVTGESLCVLINRLRGLSLPRNRLSKLADRPDMIIAVYHGRKTTRLQQ